MRSVGGWRKETLTALRQVADFIGASKGPAGVVGGVGAIDSGPIGAVVLNDAERL